MDPKELSLLGCVQEQAGSLRYLTGCTDEGGCDGSRTGGGCDGWQPAVDRLSIEVVAAVIARLRAAQVIKHFPWRIFGLHIVLVLTMPLWVGYAIYGLIATRLIDPNGIMLWGLLSAGFVFVAFGLFRCLWGGIRLVFLERARKLAGSPMSPQERLAALHLGPLHLSMLVLYLMIPVGVSVVLTSPPPPYMVRTEGKLRMATQREAVEIVLTRIRESHYSLL